MHACAGVGIPNILQQNKIARGGIIKGKKNAMLMLIFVETKQTKKDEPIQAEGKQNQKTAWGISFKAAGES